MRYKDYSARIEYDADDHLFHGQVLGIDDAVSFHGDHVAGLPSAFKEAVHDYTATCAKLGKEPRRKYSGRLMLRIGPAVRAKAALAAAQSGKSLNRWCEDALAAVAEIALSARRR